MEYLIKATLSFLNDHKDNMPVYLAITEIRNKALSFDRINITFVTRWFDYQISPLSTFNGLEKNKRYWNSHDIYCFLNPVDEDGHMNNKSFVELEDNAKDIIEYMDSIIFRGLGKGGNG